MNPIDFIVIAIIATVVGGAVFSGTFFGSEVHSVF